MKANKGKEGTLLADDEELGRRSEWPDSEEELENEIKGLTSLQEELEKEDSGNDSEVIEEDPGKQEMKDESVFREEISRMHNLMKKSVLDQKMPDQMGVDQNKYKTTETEDEMSQWVKEEERAELYQEYEKYERALDKYTH